MILSRKTYSKKLFTLPFLPLHKCNVCNEPMYVNIEEITSIGDMDKEYTERRSSGEYCKNCGNINYIFI